MAKKQTISAASVPEKFQSLEELHKLGFALERERESPALEQPWIQKAKQMGISLAELGRRCGLTRQGISKAVTKKNRLDIISALLICEALGIPVEEGFRLSGGQPLYIPCRKYDENLFVNLRTLEVVPSGKRQEAEKYEKLYYIQTKGA